MGSHISFDICFCDMSKMPRPRAAQRSRAPAVSRWSAASLLVFASTASYLVMLAYVRNTEGTVKVLEPGLYNLSCSTDSLDKPVVGCSPTACARMVKDDFITSAEANQLIHLAETGMRVGGYGSGPPSVLDLTSGAVSSGDKFLDVYRVMDSQKLAFDAADLQLYRDVIERVRAEVLRTFGLKRLYLTSPLFFSRIDAGKPAKTMNDEYWHAHIDKLQYGSFAYTALIYLNDHGTDFTGGLFAFSDSNGLKNFTVAPRMGRLSMFTSGGENVHYVQRVETGTRYALTIAFTCDMAKEVTNFLSRARVQSTE